MQLTCPKCQGAMRQYERSGIHVDQCAECRGIFLDRGELEKLIDAENAYNAPPPVAAPAPPPAYSQERRYEQPRHDTRYDPRYDSHGGYGHRKKKKSFFEDLFD